MDTSDGLNPVAVMVTTGGVFDGGIGVGAVGAPGEASELVLLHAGIKSAAHSSSKDVVLKRNPNLAHLYAITTARNLVAEAQDPLS